MNAQELIKKSALIEKTLQEQGLQERARPFISDNSVIKTEELEKTLKELQDTNRDLKVGIIGRVKAGKSSLLNALIFEGVEVLPKAATPMTASLTILKYAQNLSAEVEFYSPKDILELENEHERYVREFNRIVDEEVKKQKEKQSLSNRAKEGLKKVGNMLNRNKNPEAAPKERVLSDEEIVKRAERIAKDTLKGDEKLVSSHDQYEKIKKSGSLNTKNLDPRIQANSLQELNQKLLQFVGADGKYMPCTKAVQISLNNPNLKDLEVIDTPGVNDPIASREERTKALLKDCDVVFIISPSNQFLTESDMSLFDRVSNKEGLQEIYFVASQADSAVLSMSEVEKSRHHLPTAFENAQKSLSSQLNNIMEKLIQNYPNQREVFEKAIKNGVILASGVCFSMHKDFNNQASWERSQKTEEYHNALRNLKDSYPDAFSSDDKSKESLLFLSNMGTIEERLKKAAKEKEKIISQKLQDYAQSQANNLHSLIAQLLQDLEDEKKRVKNADISAIKEQIKAYEKLSGNIEMKFREAYEEFILHFINNIRGGLNETLTKAIQTAKVGAQNEEGVERYTERVEQGGFWGSLKRNFLFWADDDAGYDEVSRTRATIKAGAVLDYLIEMHERCERALNDSANSFKVVFKKELYAKVFKQLREIISDDLIDEVAFKKSVMAVLDRIEFKEFDYTDKLPGEIGGKTGFLKGYEANAFIQSVEKYLRYFEAETKNDVKGYTGGDKEASKESLKHAEHILWLISCERGGIESDDLEFLQELYEEEGKQVFIVLSRADRRTKSQLEEVAKQIRETLENNGIEFLGIGAYSATRYLEIKEFSEKSKVFNSLEEFLMKLNQRSEKQNEILGYLYEVHSMYERAINQDANRFKRYQKALHSVKLDLMQKGFDDFNDATFSKIHSLKKEFSEQEESKRENLARLNEVIGLFKESIDKVFDRVSAFTWEKYKEQNDDEEDDEINRREFEEIKEMVLYFRDRNLFYLDWYEWSEEEIQETRDSLDKCNELLQLHYSLKNLQTFREYKETNKKDYQESLNNEELQNNLREWRDL
ncbi:dynamin family protein, partial [Helicobacter pylori]